MNIGLTFSKTFDEWYQMYLEDTKGEKFLKLEGIHPTQLDVGRMSHKYFTDEACNFTIDNNANTNEENSYNNYFAEITKGLHKLEGYYLLHRYAEKRFDLEYADDLLNSIILGDLYFHDPTKIQIPYCYAYSTAFIMLEGRPYGQLKSVAPKRSDSFMAEVIETTMDLSQEFAGAIAMGDLIVNLCYYLKNEGYGIDWDYNGNEKLGFSVEEKKYIVNQFQKFVHVMNNKFRLAGESPFTNISIFDRGKLHTLFDDYVYPDGSTVDFEYVLAVQELFMDFFSKGDPNTGLPYRFPVVTVNFEKDINNEPVDKEFAMRVSHYNREKGCFNIYCTDGTKVASCPLSGDTKVLIRNTKGNIRLTDISKIYNDDVEIFYNGEFKKGKFIKSKADFLYEITLENGAVIKTSPEHLNVTAVGDKMTKDLIVGDLIPVNTTPYNNHYVGSTGLGYLAGAYAGDGYITQNDGICLTLGVERKQDVIEKLKDICKRHDFKYSITENKDKSIRFNVQDGAVVKLVESIVIGKGALNKRLNIENLITKSIDFRLDFLQGYIETDGRREKDLIDTSSKNMADDLQTLCNICGIATRIKRVDRESNFGNNPYYEVVLYRNNLVSPKGQSKLKVIDNVGYFKVIDIRKLENKSHNPLAVYCFAMEDIDNPYFTLANGVITHNCRLVNDFERMGAKADSFGNGGLNIGSHRVVTINLPRIALKSSYQDDSENCFFDLLDARLEQAKDLLLIHREEILRRRVERGFLKFFDPKQVGWFSLDGMFSTFGINGVYEMCNYMGYDITTDEGRDFVGRVLKHIENYAVQCSKDTGHSFNVEEIPAENTGAKLATKDSLMYDVNCTLYSNQFIPLMADVPVMDRLETEGKYMAILSGGAITHINVLSKIDTDEKMYKLMLQAMHKGVEHFAINYGFNECINGHVSIGGNKMTECPCCGEPIKDHITRVVGFFTRVSAWSPTRKEEFKQRVFKEV